MLEDRTLLTSHGLNQLFGHDTLPAHGEYPLLPILLDYSDRPNRHTSAYFDELLFGEQFPSLSRYFNENSNGEFSVRPAEWPTGSGTLRVQAQDDPETPDLDESQFGTTRVVAGGGSILFANLQASNDKWLRADNGGGGALSANVEEPADWENFKIIDRDGGELRYGDEVQFKSLTGHYMTAFDTSNTVTVWSSDADAPETVFHVESASDLTGEIAAQDADGDGKIDLLPVYLRTYGGGYLKLVGHRLEIAPLPGAEAGRSEFTFQLRPTVISNAAYLRNAANLAYQAGFRFDVYTSDGLLNSASELSVLVIEEGPRFSKGGAVRGSAGRFTPGDSPVDVQLRAAMVGEDASFELIAHEVTHLLGAPDLYGAWDAACVSNDLTLMSCSPGEQDVLATSEIEATTQHLDPWDKMLFGWVAPRVYDVANPQSTVTAFNLNDGPVIIYDSTRLLPQTGRAQEYFILEQRPIDGQYDADVTGVGIPVHGVAVWYVAYEEVQRNGKWRPQIARVPWVEREDGIYGVFALGHLGAHIGDPTAVAGIGARDVAHNKLWREGDYRLRWGTGQDIGVDLAIERTLPTDFGLVMRRGSSPPLGGRLSQHRSNQPHVLDQYGAAVVTADFNGDGFHDLAIGAPGDAAPSGQHSGAVYVYHGSALGPQFQYAIRQDGLGGNETGDEFGAALAAGDFDGDGFVDLAVGAPGEAPGSDPRSGAVFLYRGTGGGFVPHQVVTQTGIDAGGNEAGDRFGQSLVFADFDGDGRDELAVGAPGEDDSFVDTGAVYVFRGGDRLTPFSDSRVGFVAGSRDGARFGTSLAVGNFDGDPAGRMELAVGAPQKRYESEADRPGAVFIYLLDNGTWQRTQSLNQAGLGAEEDGDLFGAALAAADINADGVTDLIVGGPGENIGSGAVFVFRGSASAASPLVPTQLITRGSETNDLFGSALAIGDFTGDGIADVAIGAPGEAPEWDSRTKVLPPSGAVYLYRSAGSLRFERMLTQSGLDPVQPNPDQFDDLFGNSLIIGDFNRDGVGDVAVGSPGDFSYDVQPGSVHPSPGGAVYYYAGLESRLQLDEIQGSPNDDRWFITTDESGNFIEVYDDRFEIQELWITKEATTGTYKLQFTDPAGVRRTTAAVPYNATGGRLQTEIRKLSGLENAVVTTTGTSANLLHTIVFVGDGGNWGRINVVANTTDIIADNRKIANSDFKPRKRWHGRQLLYTARAELPGPSPLRINGLGGNDRLIVDLSNGNPFHRFVIFDAGTGADSLEIRGSDSPDSILVTESYVSANSANVTYSNLEQIVIDTRGNDDTISIRNTPSSLSVSADGGSGTNTFNIGRGQYIGDIRGQVEVNGSGNDTLIIDDSENLAISIDYRFNTGTADPADVEGYFEASHVPLAPPNDTVTAPRLTFESVETIEMSGGRAFLSTYNVDAVSPGTSLTISGHNLNDEFIIADSDLNADGQRNEEGDFDTRIRSDVTIDGGGGANRLVIDDRSDLGSDDYIFSAEGIVANVGTFTKDSGVLQVPVLRFADFGSVELHGSDGHSQFRIDRMLSGIQYTLNGNGGRDDFRIDVIGQVSDVYINGGTPTTTPGDSLHVTGLGLHRATLTPDVSDPTAGMVTSGSVFSPSGSIRNTITFTGIEEPVSAEGFGELTLAVPERLLRLWVRPEGEGWTNISDQRNPSDGPGVLRFIDVGSFTLDASGIDIGFQPTLEPDSLNGRRLSEFVILGGELLTVVSDRVLHGAAATASLRIRGYGIHNISGPADRMEIELRDRDGDTVGPFSSLRAYDADGNLLHHVEDELVNSIGLGGQKSDVQVTIDGTLATLSDTIFGRRITGTDIATLRFTPGNEDRLRVRTDVDMTFDIRDTLFPDFQFDPIFGLDVDPIGTFHVRPVRGTNDDNDGLGGAIGRANSAPANGTAVVFFDLREIDANFQDVDSHLPGGDAAPDVFVHRPLTALPPLTRGNTIVNGASQQALTGDSSPFGPEIVLDGSWIRAITDNPNNPPRVTGLEIASDDNLIHGLNIQQFRGDGIFVTGNGNTLTGNFIGTNATGDFSQVTTSSIVLFTEDFETDLSVWVNQQGIIVNDPIRPDNQVLTFSGLNSGGDIFSPEIPVQDGREYVLSFEYLGLPDLGGVPGDLGSFIGFSEGLPNGHRWLAATTNGGGSEGDLLVDDGQWHTYQITFDPYQSGSAYDGTPSNNTIRVMIEDFVGSSGVAGDALFDNIQVSRIETASTANGGSGVHIVNSSGNVIGGTTDIARNVISNNAANGVLIDGDGALPSLVSRWRADGDASDSAGENDGELVGGTGFTAGARGGQAFDFIDSNGNDYVRVANSPTLESENVTLSAWVKSSGPSGTIEYLAAKGADESVASSYALYQINGFVHFYIYDGASFVRSPGIPAGAVYDGTWHQLTGTFDGGHVRLYVDGAEVGAGTATDRTIAYGWPTSNDLTIARYDHPTSFFQFRGAIDDVVLFEEALSAEQVAHLHSTGIPTTGENRVQGNHIGTTADGMAALGNGESGVAIIDSTDNLIGGNSSAARNVVAGSRNGTGVWIAGQKATKNQVAGNYVGVGADGITQLANFDGVVISGDLELGFGAAGNLIGGTSEAERNIISGHRRFGVLLARTNGNTVQGNYIGTDATGLIAVRNNNAGIRVLDDEHSLIGGTAAGAGNVISGNATGIAIRGGLTVGTRVEGNLIGTTPDGRSILANDNVGIGVAGTNFVTIGGTEAGVGNLISGNGEAGVFAIGAGLHDLTIQGNYIGTDIDGTAALPNKTGVVIQDVAAHVNLSQGAVLVGGTASAAGNLISGNTENGILIERGRGNIVEGNFVGTTADGMSALGNAGGISIVNSANNMIGGRSVDARNVVSASTSGYGIAITGVGATKNLVEGNYIGTDVTGAFDRGNASSGVLLQDATQNTLRGNVISGNDANGVFLVGSTPTTDMTNLIEANYIGTDASGKRDLGNTLMGVRVFQGVGSIIRGNVVSGNDNTNVFVDATGSSVLIEDNLIGTDFTGNAGLHHLSGASAIGVTLVGQGNTVRGNVISANTVDGVNIDGQYGGDGRGSGNVFKENLIGVGLDGTTPLGNGRFGIRAWRGASDNTIGTTGTDPMLNTEGNVIAFNAQQGVLVTDNASTGNSIRGNSIHSNGGLGIDLIGEGVTANDDLDADTGPNLLQNVPVFTSAVHVRGEARFSITLESVASSHFTIDIYASPTPDPSGYGEGRRWLGAVEVDTNRRGRYSFSRSLSGLQAGEFLTATATDAAGNTSEFSRAIAIVEPGGGGGRPLLAAESGNALEGFATPLSMTDLQTVFTAAIETWRQAGVSSRFVQDVNLAVADLPGTQLGWAEDGTITFDIDAAGIGWFVDPTPYEHTEFTLTAAGAFIAAPTSPVADRYDLLTVALHEIGHFLGFEHDSSLVMADALQPSARRLPTEERKPAAAFPNASMADLPMTNKLSSEESEDEERIVLIPRILDTQIQRPLELSDDRTTESVTDWTWPPDDEIDVDGLFADFEKSLADGLLAGSIG